MKTVIIIKRLKAMEALSYFSKLNTVIGSGTALVALDPLAIVLAIGHDEYNLSELMRFIVDTTLINNKTITLQELENLHDTNVDVFFEVIGEFLKVNFTHISEHLVKQVLINKAAIEN